MRPNDQHFVHLARKIGIGDFYDFFINLGMTRDDYENLNFCYHSNPLNLKLMGLFEWRDTTECDQSPATFEKLLKALTAIKRQHYLCQVSLKKYKFFLSSFHLTDGLFKLLLSFICLSSVVVHYHFQTSSQISTTGMVKQFIAMIIIYWFCFKELIHIKPKYRKCFKVEWK